MNTPSLNQIDLAILRELANAPAGMLTPHEALRSRVRWAVIPQPVWNEIDARIDTLNQTGHIIGIPNILLGTRWKISDTGRAELDNIR